MSLSKEMYNVKSRLYIVVDPYDEGYTDGYCEAFKDELQRPTMPCPRVPSIDYADYRAGKKTYKDGWKVGYKYGVKDAQKYKLK